MWTAREEAALDCAVRRILLFEAAGSGEGHARRQTGLGPSDTAEAVLNAVCPGPENWRRRIWLSCEACRRAALVRGKPPSFTSDARKRQMREYMRARRERRRVA